MHDPTENVRREMVHAVNQGEITRESLEAQYGQVWTTDELSKEFTVKGFMAPFVVAQRKSDGKVGTLMFTHSPRFYFSWREDK